MLRLCMGFSLLRPGGRRAPWKGARPSAFSGSPSSLPLQRLYCGPQAGRFSFACAPRAPFRPFSPARFARARRRQLFAFCGPAAGRCLWPCFICALSPAPLQSAHRCTGGCRRLLHAYSAQPSAVHAASAAGTASHTPVMPHTAAMANASGTSRIKPRRSESTCAGSACSTAGK